jgi:hypothetical protein
LGAARAFALEAGSTTFESLAVGIVFISNGIVSRNNRTNHQPHAAVSLKWNRHSAVSKSASPAAGF